MPVRVSPEEFADKHARRLKASVEDIRAGIDRVTVAPTAKAAEKQDKMLQNLQQAVSSGKWASRLRRVSLEEWKKQAITKGIGRIAAGIDEARGKMVEFGQELLNYENSLLTQIEKMPDLTLEDSISRMNAWVRGMAKFSRK
jgi:hypothetical protein